MITPVPRRPVALTIVLALVAAVAALLPTAFLAPSAHAAGAETVVATVTAQSATSVTLAVSGSGFQDEIIADDPSTSGTDESQYGRPLVYLAVRPVIDRTTTPWTIASGAANSVVSSWLINPGDTSAAVQSGIQLQADGTFSGTITIPVSAPATRPGGSATYPLALLDPAKEYVVLAYDAPAPTYQQVDIAHSDVLALDYDTIFDPAVTQADLVSQTGSAITLAVDATGFSTARAPYVAVREVDPTAAAGVGTTSYGAWALDVSSGTGAAPYVGKLAADGSIDGSVTVTVPADRVDVLVARHVAAPSAEFVVYAYEPGANHLDSVTSQRALSAPLALDWTALAKPGFTATVGTQSPTALPLTVKGYRFDEATYHATTPPPGSDGVYVTFVEHGTDTYVSELTSYVPWASFADGDFTLTTTFDDEAIAALDRTKSYDIAVLKAHTGWSTPANWLRQPVSLNWDALFPATDPGSDPDPDPTGPAFTATVGTQSATALQLNVTGHGFAAADYPQGVYVSVAEHGGNAYVSGLTSYVTAITDGDFTSSATFGATQIAALDRTKSYDVIVVRAHDGFATPAAWLRQPITLDWSALLPGTTPGTTPGTDPSSGPTTDPDPGTGTTDPVTPVPASAGHLSWAVYGSWNSYVTGPIAQGSISASQGTTASGTTLTFPQRGTAVNTDGVGATDYSGAVTYTGHGTTMLTLANPIVTVQSATLGVLSIVANGTRVDFATLDLGSASRAHADGMWTWSGVPARLTAAGSAAFEGNYAAGTLLAPVTFAVGSNSTAPAAPAAVVAAATKPRVAASAPPATTGLALVGATGEALQPGATVTIQSSGFRPNETGILVVVYSTPIVLDRNATADAHGTVTWSGALPTGLESGQHTLTLQGSVNRGTTFVVAAQQVKTLTGCPVTSATLGWGFKESFRSYVSGSIANGSWTTSGDASYATPTFTWAKGTGTVDAATSVGEVDFTGGVTFTGHSGALDTTISDPRLELVDAHTAVLHLDVSSVSREAAESGASTAPVVTEDVPFVDVALDGAAFEDGTLTVKDAATTLTPEGSAVFDSYAAGEAFDPVSLAVKVEDCASADTTIEAAGTTPSTSAVDDASDGGSGWTWPLVGLGVVVVAGGAWLVTRRTRARQ